MKTLKQHLRESTEEMVEQTKEAGRRKEDSKQMKRNSWRKKKIRRVSAF